MIRETKKVLRLESRTDSLKLFRDFVRDTMAIAQIDETLRPRIVLAVDEAITSIIRHANAHKRVGQIELLIALSSQTIEVSITDSGCSFESDNLDTSDLSELIKHSRAIEMGDFLIRHIMDEINYLYRKGQENRLRMVKFLTAV